MNNADPQKKSFPCWGRDHAIHMYFGSLNLNSVSEVGHNVPVFCYLEKTVKTNYNSGLSGPVEYTVGQSSTFSRPNYRTYMFFGLPKQSLGFGSSQLVRLCP